MATYTTDIPSSNRSVGGSLLRVVMPSQLVIVCALQS